VALGFCFWEWQLLAPEYAGVGTSLFFLLALALSLGYLHRKGMCQNRRSLAVLLVAVAGALPFVLYGERDFNLMLLGFEGTVCLIWVAFTCKTSINSRLSGLVVMDCINQMFVVPCANGMRLFTTLVEGLGQRRKGRSHKQEQQQLEQTATRRRQRVRALLLTIALLAVFALVLVLIVTLLGNSDTQFDAFLTTAADALKQLNVLEYLDLGALTQRILHLALGVPVACYLFGLLSGNVYRRHTSAFKQAHAEEAFVEAHVLPATAFAVLLALLIAVYICYFVVMAPYLFSALTGVLPPGFTYAEYARRGFFELCGVAVINLAVVYLCWLLAKRASRSYPRILRILSGGVALLTCLLVITAASKMLLYIQSYGLSPLRLYTSWFMVGLLLCFVLIVLWHLRPFNVARPLIILVVVLSCTLALWNTDGSIARYNTSRYLNGDTTQIDVALLESLSDAALPALHDLESQAPDSAVQQEARAAIARHTAAHAAALQGEGAGQVAPWYSWNVVSARDFSIQTTHQQGSYALRLALAPWV
jgi:hypothetical protein